MIPFLAGLIVVVGLVGVALYAIHKLIRQGREGEDASSPRTRGTRSASEFMFSTVQEMTLRVKAQDVKIEESRLALKLAAEQERIQQTIFQEMSAGVLVFSSDGFLVRANPAARTLLGVDTIARRRYPEVLGADSHLAGMISDCLSSGEAQRQENLPYESTDGENHNLRVSVVPVQNSSGEIVSVVCLLNESRPSA